MQFEDFAPVTISIIGVFICNIPAFLDWKLPSQNRITSELESESLINTMNNLITLCLPIIFGLVLDIFSALTTDKKLGESRNQAVKELVVRFMFIFATVLPSLIGASFRGYVRVTLYFCENSVQNFILLNAAVLAVYNRDNEEVFSLSKILSISFLTVLGQSLLLYGSFLDLQSLSTAGDIIYYCCAGASAWLLIYLIWRIIAKLAKRDNQQRRVELLNLLNHQEISVVIYGLLLMVMYFAIIISSYYYGASSFKESSHEVLQVILRTKTS